VSEIKKGYSFEIRLSFATAVLKYLILQTILLSVLYIALHEKSKALCTKCGHVFLCYVVE